MRDVSHDRPALHVDDDGLLGPHAVAWRVLADPASIVGALRGLIIQSLHPLAMAGVAQHSTYSRRPIDRFQRTTYYMAATAFGDLETAFRAVAHVRRRHVDIKGIDPITGRCYSAEDPDTQVWVHATAWHSLLAAYRVFGSSLTEDEEDRYFAEGSVIGSLLGTPQDQIPASAAEMRAYFERVRPQLRMSDAARAAIEFVARPRPARELLRYYPVWRVCGSAAVALVPRDLRRMAGIDRGRARDAAAIVTARPMLTGMTLPMARPILSTIVGTETTDLIKARRRTPSNGRSDAMSAYSAVEHRTMEPR